MPRAMHGAPGTNTDTGDLRASSAIHSHPVADERVDALIRASAENAGVSLGGSEDEGKAVREPRRGWMEDDAFASALERISAGGESWQRCHPHTHTGAGTNSTTQFFCARMFTRMRSKHPRREHLKQTSSTLAKMLGPAVDRE